MKRRHAPVVSTALVLLLALPCLGGCTELGDEFLQQAQVVAEPDATADVRVDVTADVVLPDTISVPDAGPDAEPTITWEGHIKPLFKQTGCSASFCHGNAKAGGLSVATPEALILGGKHGAAVVPCAPGEGTIIDKFQTKPSFGKKMPLGGTTYTDAQRQLVIDWIASGAEQPGGCP
ncbi:MAG: hypothetical protein R3F39_16145 [Myxococcota bacterium]